MQFPRDISTQYLIFLMLFNFPIETSSVNTFNEPVQRGSEYEKVGRKSDGTGEFELASNLGSG